MSTTATQTKLFIERSKIKLEGVTARIFMPGTVEMNELIIVPIVEVSVLATLANGLRETKIEVNPCDIFNWQVIRAIDKNVVESEPGVTCGPIVLKNLAPFQVIWNHEKIKLHVDLYEDGQEYVLIASYYGKKAEAKFRVKKIHHDVHSIFEGS